jgi:AbrB family looped-hinge helix DNA binding protein
MRVTSNGRVTIPADVRRALNIQPGTDVHFESRDGGVSLVVGPGDNVSFDADRPMSTEQILALARPVSD